LLYIFNKIIAYLTLKALGLNLFQAKGLTILYISKIIFYIYFNMLPSMMVLGILFRNISFSTELNTAGTPLYILLVLVMW
jgi:hypothetical protein